MTAGPQLLFGRWQSVNTKLNSWIIPKGQLMIKEKSNWMSDLINAVYNQSTFQFSSVQLLSRVWLFCDPMNYSTPGLPVHHQLPESTHVHCVGDAIQPSHPLSSPSPPPSIFRRIGIFSNESVLRIRWPKYCSFSFSISPCNEHSGLISFRMDWFDLLAAQGTLQSLLQHQACLAGALLFWCWASHCGGFSLWSMGSREPRLH